MKDSVIAIVVLTVFTLTPATALAHSGRTDSSGGHNCSATSQAKGLCTGYHYHNGGPAVYPVLKQETPPVTIPTAIPTVAPTVKPTTKPTVKPTLRPTVKPTPSPTPRPSPASTPLPSSSPSPTLSPTATPSPKGKVTQTQAKKSGGIFSWFFSMFSR